VEENRHFENWRKEKSTPWPEYIPLETWHYKNGSVSSKN